MAERVLWTSPIVSISVLIGVLAGGCYSTPEGFARRAAKLDCVRFEECARAQFDAEFDDVADCKDEFEDEAIELIDDIEDAGCDYVPEAGRECIHTAYRNRKDCSEDASEEIAAECQGDDIFDCPGGLEPGIPMLPFASP